MIVLLTASLETTNNCFRMYTVRYVHVLLVWTRILINDNSYLSHVTSHINYQGELDICTDMMKPLFIYIVAFLLAGKWEMTLSRSEYKSKWYH